MLNVCGYKMYRRDRIEGRGGGVLFYVKDSIRCEQFQWSCMNEIECIGLELILYEQMSFFVIGIYRPPSAKAVFYENLDALIKKCNINKEIILLGDFNVNWNDELQRKK